MIFDLNTQRHREGARPDQRQRRMVQRTLPREEPMTKPKHLPECFNGRQRSHGLPCICDRLRACEQRVLDAAREAVIKCDHYYCDEQWSGSQHIYMSDALAAIDALRQPPPPTAHYDPAAKDNRP